MRTNENIDRNMRAGDWRIARQRKVILKSLVIKIMRLKVALVRSIIDYTWKHNIAWENIDLKSARRGTGHLTCATSIGHMRIIENTRIAFAREIIDSNWRLNIAWGV